MLRLIVLWRLFRLMRLLLLGALILGVVALLAHGHLKAPSLPSATEINRALGGARREVQQLLAPGFRRR